MVSEKKDEKFNFFRPLDEASIRVLPDRFDEKANKVHTFKRKFKDQSL